LVEQAFAIDAQRWRRDGLLTLGNTCPHAGFPLGEGDISGEYVICPGHSFYYSLKTGECRSDSSLKVACYRIIIEGDDIKLSV
jgi:nitrite reductase/ring-hydroxylating ferredoxin subunit